ncbi:MAG: hypothetical protein NC247_02230 [Ruminococcus flavefaciens]|nr:hypothetical protein [Ruminococcus flavefaciens]
MAIYRQYEDPYKLEQRLAELKQELAYNPYDMDLAIEIAELEERINFAWQDDEAEMEGYE